MRLNDPNKYFNYFRDTCPLVEILLILGPELRNPYIATELLPPVIQLVTAVTTKKESAPLCTIPTKQQIPVALALDYECQILLGISYFAIITNFPKFV